MVADEESRGCIIESGKPKGSSAIFDRKCNDIFALYGKENFPNFVEYKVNFLDIALILDCNGNDRYLEV